MGFIIFFKRFKKAITYSKKVFSFWNKCIWNGCGKFSLLWREYLSSIVNVLTNSPKISDLTKREVSQLALSQNDEQRG